MTSDDRAPSPWGNARPRGDAGKPRRTGPAQPLPPREARDPEIRLYGLNACRAAFAHRPHDLRKVYLTAARMPALKDVLAWCVRKRIGYRLVEDADLDRLTSSRHHEGVAFDVVRIAPFELASWLAAHDAAPAASTLLWLDGVGNPHNFGALLRSAAHFGVAGVIVDAARNLDVSGAAARVAEGAAETVPVLRVTSSHDAFAALRDAGYALAATVPSDGVSLYETALPTRLVVIFGAEGEGASATLIDEADLRLTIPGSGAMQSLNVAASVAVVLGEAWRQGRKRAAMRPARGE